jgi:hypothetical protein
LAAKIYLGRPTRWLVILGLEQDKKIFYNFQWIKELAT